MRGRTGIFVTVGMLLGLCLAMKPVAGHAAEGGGDGISYDQTASEEDQVKHREVGVEGMYPVCGADVADGVYEVEVESSSSMFRVEKAELQVREGEMRAVLTLGGTGYLKLFMGTKGAAAESDPSEYIGHTEDEEGRYTYEVPVEALDLPIDCAAFSRNREKWYDRQILFRAGSLPDGAVLTELPDYEQLEREAKERRIEAMRQAQGAEAAEGEQQTPVEPAFIELEDGEYAVSVELTGGSGRSAVDSPAGLLVRDGRAFARIRWSSSSYDYMLVGGQRYLPVNEEGYSTFEIPILIFDEPMEVIADTTAMSTPHEVEYTLVFHGDDIMSTDDTPQAAAKKVVCMALGIAAVCGLVSWIRERKRRVRR